MNKKYEHIQSVSYIGKPKNNTAMFITEKASVLLSNLYSVENCLVFCDRQIDIPDDLLSRHHFCVSNNPQLEYVQFVNKIDEEQRNELSELKYQIKDYFTIGENVSIGKNSRVEPNVFIDHHVVIGDNCLIKAGSILRNCVVGDNFTSNEGVVIGTSGFTFTKDKDGNVMRIPSLGKVKIGNNVEIGSNSTICRGSADYTYIGDNTKLDCQVYLAHDVRIEKNCQITSGVTIGGYSHIQQDTFIGFNTTIKNRIKLGKNCLIGSGANIIDNFDDNNILIGNPARILRKKD